MIRTAEILLISRTGSLAGRRQQVPGQFAAVYEGYAAALDRAPLDADTRRAYGSRIRGYLAWLDGEDLTGRSPLSDPHDRDFAVRDYRTYLKTAARRKPATVEAHLISLDHFYVHHLGLDRPRVRRDKLPRRAPRALDARQQKRYLRAAERRPLARDRAIGRLLIYSGLRVSELVALDQDDVPLSARLGKVIVRAGKNGYSREVPLAEPTARAAVTEWKADRRSWQGASGTPALFLNRRGGRLSARSVGQLVSELAADADLVDGAGNPEASAHTLRHTFGTNLVRAGTDLVIVAELMGHHDLETTRLYTLPTDDDVAAAVARLPGDQ
jgi:site-specific recombinase XerD